MASSPPAWLLHAVQPNRDPKGGWTIFAGRRGQSFAELHVSLGSRAGAPEPALQCPTSHSHVVLLDLFIHLFTESRSSARPWKQTIRNKTRQTPAHMEPIAEGETNMHHRPPREYKMETGVAVRRENSELEGLARIGGLGQSFPS